VASALCGVSGSLTQLILFRIVQGAGGGLIIPVGQAMLFRTFPPERRARAVGMVVLGTSLGPAVGPVLGSLVVDALSAREGDHVLRQRLSATRTLHAPHHLDVEVAATVRELAAGKKITGRGEQMLADYSRLRITRHPVWPFHHRMWELRHSLGAYDAAYIALAEALGCELLTGDVKLKNAAGHHATVIVTR
jgi:predicted nucleic acid-binding protein